MNTTVTVREYVDQIEAIMAEQRSVKDMATRRRNEEANGELSWQKLDMDNMSRPLKRLFDDYKAKQNVASDAREKFDAALEESLRKAGHIQDEMFVVISHKFGGVGFAETATPPKKRGEKRGSVTV